MEAGGQCALSLCASPHHVGCGGWLERMGNRGYGEMRALLAQTGYHKWSTASRYLHVYFMLFHAEESEGPWGASRCTGNFENQALSLQIGAGTNGGWGSREGPGKERKEGEQRSKGPLDTACRWS